MEQQRLPFSYPNNQRDSPTVSPCLSTKPEPTTRSISYRQRFDYPKIIPEDS